MEHTHEEPPEIPYAKEPIMTEASQGAKKQPSKKLLLGELFDA